MKVLFASVFLILPLILPSQNNKLDVLSKQITEYSPSDSLKVVSICNWIMENISYDYENYNKDLAGEKMNDDCCLVESIIQRKKAVCEGYANLFNVLCQSIGIKSVKIIGYALSNDETDHAWNAVKINRLWYLMDLTWADCEGDLPVDYRPNVKEIEQDSLDDVNIQDDIKKMINQPPTKQEEDMLAFITSIQLTPFEKDSIEKANIEARKLWEEREINEKRIPSNRMKRYLWADPSVFILDHLPQDPIWQFLESSIGFNTYKKNEHLDNWYLCKPNYGFNVLREEGLDSLVQVYNSIKRRCKYHNGDVWNIFDAAEFFQKRGDEYYEACFAPSEMVNGKVVYVASQDNLLKMKQAKTQYLSSLNFFKQLLKSEKLKESAAQNLEYNYHRIVTIDKYIRE
jgi:Transglutaminase-like superfamily